MFVLEYENVKTIKHGEKATDGTEFVSLCPRGEFCNENLK